MPPTTSSTSRWTSFVAAASATSSSVALSSTNNSIGRPSSPPRALMSSITILVTFTLAMPMKDSAPVWSVMRPTRAGRLIVLVIVASSRAVGAEKAGGFGLAEVSGLLEDRRDLGVGHEFRPTGLVPVEQRPHAVLLGGVAEHGRALRAVERALVGAPRPEHLEESVDILDGRRCQDHDGSLSEWIAADPASRRPVGRR